MRQDDVSAPALWWGVPHGFYQIDLAPSLSALAEKAEQIRSLPPGEERARADSALRLYAASVLSMRGHQIMGCALGLHPGEGGEVPAMSTLVVSRMSAPSPGAKAALTRLISPIAGATPNEGVRPIELPCGLGFVTERERRTASPRQDPATQGFLEMHVWQGTVVIPDLHSSAVFFVQLVTPEIEQADDYRNVLVGVARTVTFTDPLADTAAPPPGLEPEPDDVRNVFG
ncbi:MULTISPECIES: hypothetical protein [unclassified Streptomyces]|uniref:hypothetical protein n=1 Tax=unclassified Streptomyces TaxID=2593676 RepID=UPI000DBA7D04|nr:MULTISPECIES: hypothetical protein [unclassified Streptomyces]MYT73317.1 hypothetical protein [Streptomyces sp. SID8367]RAJ74917.1 hypothetical protein K377_06684 [Streptomyces sp. PsTaAH-137]